MTQTTDYSHRSPVQKLGVKPDQRVEVSGDIGAELRRDLREALGRGFVRSGELDGAIVMVESFDQAIECLRAFRPRMKDSGYLWILTRKRGEDGYVNQMTLVPPAKSIGLIDNKTCSVDDGRSGIRFVVPRALRGNGDASAA